MLWRRPPDAPPGSAPETGWSSGGAGRPRAARTSTARSRSVPLRVDPHARASTSCLIMLTLASYAPTLAAAVPPYWYALAAVLIITPLYFLLSRPRKKRADSKWKG